MDIGDFLLARIAEDESAARAAIARNGATWSTAELHDGARITGTAEFGNPRAYRGDDALWDDEGAMGMFEETAAHVVRHAPARVLAECDAKRRTVEAVQYLAQLPDHMCMPDRESAMKLDRAVVAMAAVYADHPDYDSEWKP